MRQLPDHLSGLPVAWIMAFRPDQGLKPIQDTRDDLVGCGAEYIQLGPLDRDAVAQVAADILGAHPDQELLQRAERVQGNPFLLVELLRGLQDDDLVKYEGDVVSLSSDRLPRRLSDGMRGRLGRLSPTSERAATFASSLGRRFTLQDISALTSLPMGELVDPVTELIDADIFVDDGDRLAFRHDMIREAIRASLLSPVRKGLDRQAADVLLARGAMPSEVAMQLADSAEEGDDVAIRILLKAAEQLANTDPAGSASLAQRGLELSPEHHSLRGALVVQRVMSLFAGGMAEEGRRYADSAMRQTLPAEEEAKVRYSVASMFDLSPEVRAASARAGLALPNLSTDLKASLWASLYHSLAVAGRTDEALNIEAKAKKAAYASTDEAYWLAFELPRSGLQYQLLNFGDALSIAIEAERRDLRGREDPRMRLTRLFHAWVLMALDRFHEANELINDGIVAAQRDRQNWALRTFETTGARLMLQQGLLTEASAALEGRFSLEEAHLVAGALHAPSVVALAKLMIHTGDERGTQDVAEIAKVMVRSDARVVKNAAIWTLALVAMSKGNPKQAHSWLANDGLDARLSLFPLFPHEMTDDVELLRIAKAVSDEQLGEAVLRLTEHRASLNPDAHSCRAVAAHARGLWSGSVEDLGLAASLLRSGPRPLALASALEDLGLCQLRAGATAEAIKSFDEALRATGACGAVWDSARIRRRLRELGIHRRYAHSDRPKSGWGSLTDAEVSVAVLATDGQTNRQIAESLFVSPHTVNTHMRHVFEKLGVNSRVQLTRFVRDRQ